jgi:hypothetical protein
MPLQNRSKNTRLIKQEAPNFLTNRTYSQQKDNLTYRDALRFTDKVELTMGAQWKQWVLNSQGTIFADTAGKYKVNETGVYAQLKKKLLNDV